MLHTRLLALLLLMPPAALAAAKGNPLLEKQDLFTAGAGGYQLYRIPGLVATRSGALLAYCEGRKSDRGDWGAQDLFLRRSTDGGRTWSAVRRLVEAPAVPKNPAALAHGAGRDEGVTMNNPVAIADRKRGVVHFLYCAEYAHCYYLRSTDDGATWSTPVEITSAFEALRPRYNWAVLATGPGHGIQLRSGRLLVPIWLSTGTGGGAHRPSVVSTLYSDDEGRTWKAGEIIPATSDVVNPNETTAAELSDGRVMLNIRHEGKDHHRAVCVSKDGSGGWSAPRLDAQLPDPICEGSLVRAARGREKPLLLFSNPDSATQGQRRNLTVRVSRDDGETWSASRSVEPEVSAYSDLAAAPDGTLFCLYERGGLQGSVFKTAALTLARFNEEWLTEHR